ncbi:MAG: succinyl-diaminopimelate desuccinylase [Holosporales bacterium]|jgi:succinyl-diaminopimelate desuccinylase|nr:succinyl-diaminopimelate desuccinylase [Holosporales bacterium]
MDILPLSSLSPLELTRTLVTFRSITPCDDGCLAFLEDLLKGMGFSTTLLEPKNPGGPKNLCAVYGGGERTLVFVGHIDVVPEGAEPWDAFTPKEEAGVLFGRGVADMKGGAAAFIVASARFLQKHPNFPGKLIILLTGDEEIGTPDGIRSLLPWAVSRYGPFTACLVGEPSCYDFLGDNIAIGHRGSLNLHITACGIQGHAACPELARNPIPILLRYIEKITHHVWEQDAGDFTSSHLEVTSIDVGNTVSNIIPCRAEAQANIRFHIQHTSASITHQLQTWAANISEDLSVEVHASGEAFLCHDESLMQMLEKAVKTVLKTTPKRSTGGGTTDGRFVSVYCPVVEFGMIGSTMHHVREHIPAADCERLTQVYEVFLDNFFLKER